ncbi:hypothetical protein WJX72_010495 [[Myrmecia] bisecta]|uniref:Uncharacterized protein n=1 Tax=[Myrmecia] bisecta TaxID=41462 RepID=A0AAW1PHF4_9CHLO
MRRGPSLSYAALSKTRREDSLSSTPTKQHSLHPDTLLSPQPVSHHIANLSVDSFGDAPLNGESPRLGNSLKTQLLKAHHSRHNTLERFLSTDSSGPDAARIAALQRELEAAKTALQHAEEDRNAALQAAESAVAEAEGVRGAVEDMFLSQEEVEEAALRCTWLARYWGLAERYGVHPAIASSRAAYWGSVAPPLQAVHEAACQYIPESNAHLGSSLDPRASIHSQGLSRSQGLHGSQALHLMPRQALEGSGCFPKLNGSQTLGASQSVGGTHAAEANGAADDLHTSSPSSVRNGVSPAGDAATSSANGVVNKLDRLHSLQSHKSSGSDVGMHSPRLINSIRRAQLACGSEAGDAASELAAGRGRIQATAADVVEIERAVREVESLRLEGAVLVAISDFACSRRLTFQPPLGSTQAAEATSQPRWMLPPVDLDEAEAEEAAFRRSWVAYLWGRAAVAGLAPEVAHQRATYWKHKLDAPPVPQDFALTASAMQEMRILGVEQKLWQLRHQSQGQS